MSAGALDRLQEKDISEYSPLEAAVLFLTLKHYEDAENAAAELEALRRRVAQLEGVEVAAHDVITCFMETDVWLDGTPAREEAVSDMVRDQKLDALATVLMSAALSGQGREG